MDIREDLARALAAGVASTVEEMEEQGFSLDDQLDDVLDSLYVHRLGGTRQLATDREIYIVEELIGAGLLDEGARDYFERMDPDDQPERERWLFETREGRAARRQAQETAREWRQAHPGEGLPDYIVAMLREVQHSRRTNAKVGAGPSTARSPVPAPSPSKAREVTV